VHDGGWAGVILAWTGVANDETSVATDNVTAATAITARTPTFLMFAVMIPQGI
jgi:hypothetical protein